MNTKYNFGDIIIDRYSIINKISQGNNTIIYSALDIETQWQVAVKTLYLSRLDDWEKIDFFERQAKILQQLKHVAIPKYLNYFQVEMKEDIYLFIVQQLASGQSLAKLIEKGWQPSELEVKKIARQILDILIYLQEFNPPVIHRGIKPQNIIYQPDTGKLYLVNFSLVQNKYYQTVMGSRLVETYGYMAPEQFRGNAVLSTDLYGLGCTLLFLLTCRSPAELTQYRLKIDFRSSVKISNKFADWIDKLLEPDVNNRFLTAKEALNIWQGLKTYNELNLNSKIEDRTSIKFEKFERKIIITLPPVYRWRNHSNLFYYSIIIYIIFIFNNLAFSTTTGFYGYIHGICFLATFIGDREFTQLMLALQLICLINLSPPIMKYTHFIFIFSFVLSAVDNLLIGSLKNKLFKEIICPTRIEINSNQLLIKRKFCFSWQIDLFRDDINFKSKNTNYYLEKMTSINLHHFISQLRMLLSSMAKNSIRRSWVLKKLEINQFQFGGWLCELEKVWLIKKIQNYIDSDF